jgi:HSP20 family molecular chaperone IbpA
VHASSGDLRAIGSDAETSVYAGITLPKGVTPDRVEATCKGGVPKPKEERKATTITSKTA